MAFVASRGATGSCLPTASADWKPGHSLVQTQRKGISQAQHLGGGGWVLARKASPSTPTPLGRLQVVRAWASALSQTRPPSPRITKHTQVIEGGAFKGGAYG